jgi:hypothetical protein
MIASPDRSDQWVADRTMEAANFSVSHARVIGMLNQNSYRPGTCRPKA